MSFAYYALLRVLPFVFALLLLPLLLPLFFAPCVSFHNIAYRRCCCCWHRCCSPTYSTFNAQIQEEKKLIISRYVFAQYEYNTTNMFLPFMLMIGALTETCRCLQCPLFYSPKQKLRLANIFFYYTVSASTPSVWAAAATATTAVAMDSFFRATFSYLLCCRFVVCYLFLQVGRIRSTAKKPHRTTTY